MEALQRTDTAAMSSGAPPTTREKLSLSVQREKKLGSRVALLPGKFFLSEKFFKTCKKKYSYLELISG